MKFTNKCLTTVQIEFLQRIVKVKVFCNFEPLNLLRLSGKAVQLCDYACDTLGVMFLHVLN